MSTPLLIARLLNLNEVQSGVLNIIFRIAEDQGLLLDKIEQVICLIRSKGVGAGSCCRTRLTCRTACWGSSATECSTPWGPANADVIPSALSTLTGQGKYVKQY